MIVIVDERDGVKEGYSSLFGREGVPSTGFGGTEFGGSLPDRRMRDQAFLAALDT